MFRRPHPDASKDAIRSVKLLRDSPFIAPSFDVENLENRRLLSVAHASVHHSAERGSAISHGHGARAVSEIAFNLTPTAVQTGLTNLASSDGDTAPTSTTEVYLGNANGVETYTLRESGTGKTSRLTVDSSGNAVTAPTRSTTTFGDITNTAVTDEFNALATALNLTAATSSTAVNVSTASDGSAIYSLGLTSTTSSGKTRTTRFSVDDNGDVVGNTRVPFSALSTAIQTGLTAAAPAGATALASTSLISVQTVDGVTLYSASYSTTGTRTTVTVNAAGTLTSKPTSTTAEFSDLPSAASNELQTLATAEGVATTIDPAHSVSEITEANGTVLYTVKLTATSSTDSSKTYSIALTVDAAGNPTVPDGGGIIAFGSGGKACGHFGGTFG